MKKLTISKALIIVLSVISFLSIPEISYARKKVITTKVITVKKLPRGYKVVKHGGTKYFCHNGVYYRKNAKIYNILEAFELNR